MKCQTHHIQTVGHNIKAMNQTLKSLISKGIDSKLAQRIVDENYTLKDLSALSPEELLKFGIDERLRNQIFDSNRHPIPENIVDTLLYKSRRTCCICRDSNRSIIIDKMIKKILTE